MPYGTIKVDNITFTNAGSDQTITVSGLFSSTSGNLTVTGTVSGNTIQGQTISGVTVTGTTANFTSGNFTNISGGTHTITSGVFAAGSAAAPSISFVSDPNTGIYSPGADQVAISTNGTGRLFVDASGNVGLNASTPNSYGAGYNVFTVNGSTSPVIDLNVGGTRTATFYAFSTNTLIGTQTSTPLQIITNGTEKARITSDGKLGLGTSSPSEKLSVVGGNIEIDEQVAGRRIGFDLSSNFTPSGGNVTADYGLTFQPTSDLFSVGLAGFTSLNFFTNRAERVRIDNAGRVGIGSNSPSSLLHLAAASGTIQMQFNNGGTSSFIGHDSAYTGLDIAAGGGIKFRYYNGAAFAEAARFDTAGRLGIGTTTVAGKLHTVLDSGFIAGQAWDSKTAIFGTASSGALGIAYDDTNGADISSIIPLVAYKPLKLRGSELVFNIQGNEKAKLDTSGRLLVGTSSTYAVEGFTRAHYLAPPGTDNNNQIVISSTSTGFSGIYFTRTRGTSVSNQVVVNNGDTLGQLDFFGSDGTDYGSAAGRIGCYVDGTPGADDMPGRLVFSTTADGASSPTERVRVTSEGYFKASNAGTYQGVTDLSHEFRQTGTGRGVIASASNASYADAVLTANVIRAANSAYNFLDGYSGDFGDLEVRLTGDGNGRCDGAWTGGGADYAEYFEWSDGNPDADDRRGIAVVLDGDKIRSAEAGEDPIGVISGNPSVVGDSAWNKWSGKYLRDDFGTYIQEDYEVINDEGKTVIQQRRKLNPAYDPDVEYTSREERPEWDCVGLMGKLRIRKGQPTGSRWIKMRDISATVEEWLVR